MERQVDAVVWDIGRVLVHWSIRALYDTLIPDPAQRDWFLAHVITEAWHLQHDTGVPLDAMIEERVAAFPQYRALIEAYRSRWLETLPGPIAENLALIRRLAARGVPQFAITNFGVDTWAMFRPTFPILDLLDDIVVSGVERLVKPDPAIFALAARRFGHAPDRMIFIDDNVANIAAAQALGWQVFHFTGDALALEVELTRLGAL
ncbi:HAD family hydrolase [Novosphingobium sp.]|uniref:HAD family hydrolase n=1 Tax=Novosphingobium sp. TaxID=1874826 RepID=UPI0038BA8A25